MRGADPGTIAAATTTVRALCGNAVRGLEFLLTVLGLALAATADTFYVNDTTGNDDWDGRCTEWNGGTCGPKKTIGGAISVSAGGDEISVADGVYRGSGNCGMTLHGQTLRGANGADHCILDAENQGTIFTSDWYLNPFGGTIEGLSFRNSWALNIEGDAWFRNCRIFRSGGIRIAEEGRLQVSGCDLYANSAAIIGDWAYSTAIDNSRISGNQQAVWQYQLNVGGMQITNALVCGNGPPGFPGTSGLYLYYSAAELFNCLISGNDSSGQAGGFGELEFSPLSLVNCTISGNRAASAGILSADHSSLNGESCILWGNQPNTIEATPVEWEHSLSYCDVGGGGPDPGDIDADPLFRPVRGGTWTAAAQLDADLYLVCLRDDTASWPANGLINQLVAANTADPRQFIIVANTRSTLTVLGPHDAETFVQGCPPGTPYQIFDYRLAARSPCIDAGNNTAVPAGVTLDLAGQPRFHDDPGTSDTGVPGGGGGPAIVDIGAYEFQGTSNLAGDLNCDGGIDFADIAPLVLAMTDQAAYQQQWPNCSWWQADCNQDGRVDFNDISPFVALLGH